MHTSLETSIVCIHRSDETHAIIGAGFLVGEAYVVTCAHVIAAALGIDNSAPELPEAKVSLDFPLVAPEQMISAHVIYWWPGQSDERGDIAVLHLNDIPPTGTTGISLIATDNLGEHSFKVFGFPRRYEHGVWATGKIRGAVATGWVQVEDVKAQGYHIQQGFSGGAVWDEQNEGVVGMVVAADRMPDSKVAFMIPSSLLIEACPVLKPYVINDLKNYLETVYERLAILPPYYPRDFAFDHIRQRARMRTTPFSYHEDETQAYETLIQASNAAGNSEVRQHLLEQAYQPPRMRAGNEEEEEVRIVDWDTMRTRLHRGVILGEPGSGKSWLLQYEGRRAASELLSALAEVQEEPALPLPIYIRLNVLADELARDHRDIHDAILHITQREYQWHERFLKCVKHWLNNAQCLLLLDAFDEVAEEQRDRLTTALKCLAQNSQCRILITSRTAGYQAPFTLRGDDSEREVELVGFEQEQIADFVAAWFASDDQLAGRLQDLLYREPALRSLASYPLLLSFICLIYSREKGIIPTKRSALYEKVLRFLLETPWQDARMRQDDSRIEGKITLLEHLAWHFATLKDRWHDLLPATDIYKALRQLSLEDRLGMTCGGVLHELSMQDGILVKAGGPPSGIPSSQIPYMFLHRTFHEYLIARLLADQPSDEWRRVVQTHCWFDSNWEPVIVLLAGCIDQPDELIETLLNEPYDALHQMLLLRGRCLAEVGRERARPALVQKITHAMLCLVRSGLWYGFHVFAPLLGQIGEPAIVPELVKALEEKDFRVQIGAIIALGQMQGKDIIEVMLQVLRSDGYNDILRQIAIDTLGQASALQALPDLLKIIQHESIPHSMLEDCACRALKSMGKPAVTRLVNMLGERNTDFNKRRFVAYALGKMGQSAPLLTFLKDRLSLNTHEEIHWPPQDQQAWKAYYASQQALFEESQVCSAVVEAVGQLHGEQILETLRDLLQNEDRQIRLSAVIALGQQGQVAEKALLLVIGNTSEQRDIRLKSAEILAKSESETAVDGLLDVLCDVEDDSILREKVAELLGNKRDTTVVEALCAILRDVDEEVKVSQAATLALGKIGDTSAVNDLLSVLQDVDDDTSIRSAAVQSLGWIGDVEAVESLLEVACAQDDDINVRFQAILALGMIGDTRAVQQLLSLLQDTTENGSLRQAAAYALGNIADPQSVKAMLTLFDNETGHWPLRLALEEALTHMIDIQAMDDFLMILRDIHMDTQKRIVAATVLGEIGDPCVVKDLLTVLLHRQGELQMKAVEEGQDKNRVAGEILLRQAAAEALRKIADVQAVEGLLASLQDRNEDNLVRTKAAKALGQIGDTQAVEGLVRVLQDTAEIWPVHNEVAKALRQIGDAQAVEGLLHVLQESNNQGNQSQVAQALGEIAKQGDDPEHFCDALLALWTQVAEGEDNTYTRGVLCELLMEMGFRLRMTVGHDWLAWRERLMPPTHSMREIGRR